jgi:hypothetical protein
MMMHASNACGGNLCHQGQHAPEATSSAPPPPAHGECCTNAIEDMFAATTGVYPMDTESPITIAEGSGGEGGRCAPGGHTNVEDTLPPPAAGTHTEA